MKRNIFLYSTIQVIFELDINNLENELKADFSLTIGSTFPQYYILNSETIMPPNKCSH